MSSYGIKISRPDYSVKTASNANMVMNTELPTFKVYSIIRFAYDALRDPTNIESQSHGLTYAPTFIPIKENPTTAGQWETANTGYFGGGVSQVFVDDTSVYYNQPEECYVILLADQLDGE